MKSGLTCRYGNGFATMDYMRLTCDPQDDDALKRIVFDLIFLSQGRTLNVRCRGSKSLSY